jgi:chemotaxis signal transduction protein
MPAEQRSAWLLDFGAGLRAAVAGRHLAEYLRAPQVVEVPLAPAYARGVLVWRERLVPLLDLARLVGERPGEFIGAIVLAYREAPQLPQQYGALVLSAVPREIGVNDELACGLPAEPAFWRALAASCITHEDRPTPILRVRNLFTRSLAQSDACAPAPRLVAMPAAKLEGSTDPLRVLDDALPPCLEPEGRAAASTAAGDGLIAEDMAAWESFEARIAPETVPAPLTIVASEESAATAATDENSFDGVVVLHEAITEAVQADKASRLNPPRGIPEPERRHRPLEFRWLRRLLAAGAAAVLAALLVWNSFTAPGATPAPDPAGSRAQPALDVAPSKVAPAAVPAAPVQPPN